MPLSAIVKSSLVSWPTSSPALLRTVAMTCTRLTLARKTVGSCAASDRAHRASGTALTGNRNILLPFPFHPDLAIGEMLFLPDGHQFLETVDAFQGGVEGRTAMRSGYDHRHAGLADQHTAQAMHHGDPPDGVGRRDFPADAGHDLERHR